MNKRRRISLRENEKVTGHLKGPNGFRLCRWCGTEVQPPKKTFCSTTCLHEWKLRSSTSYLRAQTYARDLGKCASCSVDTRYQKIQMEDALKQAGGNERDPAYAAFLKSVGLTLAESRRSLWQADHIRPVADGGGLCGLEGIQTLCLACHKSRSSQQASYRARPRALKVFRGKGAPGTQGLSGISRIRGFSGKIDD